MWRQRRRRRRGADRRFPDRVGHATGVLAAKALSAAVSVAAACRGDRCMVAAEALGAAVDVAAAAGRATDLHATEVLDAAVCVAAVWRWLATGLPSC